MVKSVWGTSHRGFTDWLFQRVSAIVMAVYTLWLLFFFFMHSDLDYVTWHALFKAGWVKIFTILFILSLLYHAWVGVWTIVTDYIKITWLALIVHVLVAFTLAGSFFATLMILWDV